jgi:hypothetical protein
MSGVIGEAKLSAKDIIDSVGASIGDVAFGVISHSDYDFDAIDWYGYTGSYGGVSDIPFILDQDITTDEALAKSAIETLGSYGGGDGPEDYTRMLSECQELSWRPDSVKFVIIFGDAPTHDNDFYDKNGNGDATDDYPGSYFVSTGGDPGPDVLRDTSDDLDFQTVVDELVTQEITVLSVFSPNYYEEWYNDMGRDTFMYMADETGGSYFELEDALEVSGAIADLVKAEAEETLTVHVGEEVQWAVVIDVVNPYDYSMTDVVITDRFGAEIEIEEVFSVTHGTVDLKTNGKSQKVFLKWDIGDLNHDEMARLVLLVSTDLNPAGHQEYTSPGVYELNSGATLKFKNSDGVQLSATTNHVYTTVLP